MPPALEFLTEIDWRSGWVGFLDHFPAFSAIIAAVFIFWRYINDRQESRERAADERFMAAATALASNSDRERLAGAVMLRTFLDRSLKRFHMIVFDYSVGLLRSRPESVPTNQTTEKWQREYVRPSAEELTLHQSLVSSLVEATKRLKRRRVIDPQHGLDATEVRLDWLGIDNATMDGSRFADGSLISTRIRKSSAKSTDWSGVNGHSAYFEEVDLSRSRVWMAEFVGGAFRKCKVNDSYWVFSRLDNTSVDECQMRTSNFERLHVTDGTFDRCDLRDSSFYIARFMDSGFYRSDLRNVDLNGAKFFGSCTIEDCNLTGADLSAVVLDNAILNGSDFTGVNFMPVSSMSHAQMYNVKGISPDTMKYLVDHWNVTTNVDYRGKLEATPPAGDNPDQVQTD